MQALREGSASRSGSTSATRDLGVGASRRARGCLAEGRSADGGPGGAHGVDRAWRARVLPMSDDPVPAHGCGRRTAGGALPGVHDPRARGAGPDHRSRAAREPSRAAPGRRRAFRAAIESARTNRDRSLQPTRLRSGRSLAVAGYQRCTPAAADAPVVAVSPIVGGGGAQGPDGRPSWSSPACPAAAAGVIELYGGAARRDRGPMSPSRTCPASRTDTRMGRIRGARCVVGPARRSPSAEALAG